MTASNGTKVYGDAAPEITPTYTGLVNDDVAPATAPTCSTTATAASSVATYPSSCSGAADPSYTFSYTNGSVTVTKAPLTVTAESRTLTYGFTPTTPTIARIYTGLVNGDTAPTPTQPTCSSVARGSGNTNSNVGVYASTCSGGNSTNYTFTFVRRHGDDHTEGGSDHCVVSDDHLRQRGPGDHADLLGSGQQQDRRDHAADLLHRGVDRRPRRHLRHDLFGRR